MDGGYERTDLVVRHQEATAQHCRYTFLINGVPQGAPWDSAFGGNAWTNQVIRNVELRLGDEIRVDAEGTSARLDFVQFDLLGLAKATAKP